MKKIIVLLSLFLALSCLPAAAAWHTFGGQSGSVPLSWLDDNFAALNGSVGAVNAAIGAINAIATSGAANLPNSSFDGTTNFSIDLDTGGNYFGILTGNRTITLTGSAPGETSNVYVTQD